MMSLHRFNLLLVFFLSWVGAATSKIVEPYFGEWCARQFPDEIGIVFDNFVGMIVNHQHVVPIEPFVGKWCFEQFPHQLRHVDRENAIISLHDNVKVPLEDFLVKWGEATLKAEIKKLFVAETINLEPYLAGWCVAQFEELQEDFDVKKEGYDILIDNNLIDAVDDNHVNFEPFAGEWCFAQFPTALDGLDKQEVVKGLNEHHALLENELISFTLVVNAALVSGAALTKEKEWLDEKAQEKDDEKEHQKRGFVAAVSILSIVIAFSWIVLFVTCRRLSQAKTVVKTHQDRPGEII